MCVCINLKVHFQTSISPEIHLLCGAAKWFYSFGVYQHPWWTQLLGVRCIQWLGVIFLMDEKQTSHNQLQLQCKVDTCRYQIAQFLIWMSFDYGPTCITYLDKVSFVCSQSKAFQEHGTLILPEFGSWSGHFTNLQNEILDLTLMQNTAWGGWSITRSITSCHGKPNWNLGKKNPWDEHGTIAQPSILRLCSWWAVKTSSKDTPGEITTWLHICWKGIHT